MATAKPGGSIATACSLHSEKTRSVGRQQIAVFAVIDVHTVVGRLTAWLCKSVLGEHSGASYPAHLTTYAWQELWRSSNVSPGLLCAETRRRAGGPV